MKQKVYYYHDPLHDDFAGTNIHTVQISEDYQYLNHGLLYSVGEILLRIVVYPLLFCILKIAFLQRIVNRKAIRQIKDSGIFIYGNHTNYLLDAYTPYLVSFPKLTHIIVNPDAVSIKGLKTVVKMLGAIPIPGTMKGFRRYKDAINQLVEQKRVIALYPEAHIWPYYTDIRPFGKESFHYQIDCHAPCFTFTNVYMRRKCKLIKMPKVVTYIDGPFYPDETLPRQARLKKLRDDVYNAMKARVDSNPKYNYVEYIYSEEAAEDQTSQK